VATSSTQVVKDLIKRKLATNLVLITHEAVAMYTNIGLGHTLPIIEDFFLNNELRIAIAKIK